jgi:Actin like proteins N terminal domain
MTREPVIVFGLDAGNSESTGVIGPSGNSRMLTIPAEIGAGQLRDLQRVRGGAVTKARLVSGEYVLEVDDASYFVGRLALEQSAEASSARGDVGRYWTGHTLRLLMVLAGTLIKQPSFTLRVVTGLPIAVWDMASTVPRVQQSLCGTHRFLLNGRARVMSVEAVLVLMEGAGALAIQGIAEDVPQAVVDTGGRTTNLFWAQGQRPVLPRCAGFPRGVGDVGDVLAAWFLS